MFATVDDNLIRRRERADSRRLGGLGVLGGENRFSSSSPTGFAAGDSNLYRFVDNHPTYATDPTGLYDGGSTITSSTAPISLTSGGGSYASFSPITASTSSSSYLSPVPANQTAATYTFNLDNGGSSSQAQVASYIQSLGTPSNSQPLAVMNSSGNFVPPVAMEGTPSSSVGPAGSSGSSLSSGWNSFYGGTPGGWISSGLGWMGGALNSWGSSEASGGSVGLGTAGLFAGGVFSAASNLTNPVGSVLNLVQQSNNVGERYGVGWGVAYGAGSLIGATQLTEAIAGQNFATGQALSGLNRWGMGFAGISASAGSAALGMGVAGYNPALWSGAAESTGATFGNAASNDYRATFFAANPDLEGQVVVHHAVEQQVLTNFPGVVTEGQINSLENLRGIPYEINPDVHLSQIRIEWNRFYKPFIESGTSPTTAQLLQKAAEIDARFGSQFRPTVGGG
jgi:hypothetical protein